MPGDLSPTFGRNPDGPYAEAIGRWIPAASRPPARAAHVSCAQFGRSLPIRTWLLVRFLRMLGGLLARKVLNQSSRASSLMGWMLWGLSQALLEGNPMDILYWRCLAIALASIWSRQRRTLPYIPVEFRRLRRPRQSILLG